MKSDSSVSSPPLSRFPAIPKPELLWHSASLLVWAIYIWLMLAAIPPLLVEWWFFGSVDKASVFATNFWTQFILFGIGIVSFTAMTAIPLRRHAHSPTLRRASIHVGLWIGIFAGWRLTQNFLPFLQLFHGIPFGEADPVFGHDIGFYAFRLPAIWIILRYLLALSLVGMVAALVGRWDELRTDGRLGNPELSVWAKMGLLVTHTLNGVLLLLGGTLVVDTFFHRYEILFAANEDSGVRIGAEYLDVTGFFSTLNLINLSVFIAAGIMAAVGYSLYRVVRHFERRQRGAIGLRGPAMALIGLFAIDLIFFIGVVVRDHVFVSPNEPNIQIPYIQRHMDATLRGYRLDSIETVHWTPPAEPLKINEMMSSKTVHRAPILPTWVSSLEEPPDIQHYERVMATGSKKIYGPTLDIFNQEQQLRPYYKLLSVDPVRYEINGDKRMYASAVRELPSLAFVGPKAWLRYWGSAALFLTHGMGLVMSPVDEVNAEGGVVYASEEVPPRVAHPDFEHEPRIYVGEALKDDYILTGINYYKEFDHATAQSRKEFIYPGSMADDYDGIRIDSWFKRLIFALDTKDLTAFLFSEFIDTSRTRVHVFRTPIQRASLLAPFLFLDSNNYAFIADGRVLWMLNGLTTSDRYPYSFREALGDKADERSVEKFPERIVNYAEDSVKVTIDAFSGQTRFFQMTDDPVVSTWAAVYPDLFEPKNAMPEAVQAQLTYPLQWFHIQFDDIYKRYHQRHPLEFYNVEDLWDDADEVLGSLGPGLTEFGTTDQMTFSYEGYHLLVDPADLPPGLEAGAPGDLKFLMIKPFTPEGARNLRSLVIAFQDPDDYGRLVNLRVPQGTFVPGPEQADALIDVDAQVNQQITLWVRHGSEVIRGHTLLLPVKGDVLYVEPLWIASLQNPLPEIKLFSVVYRGRTTMSTSLNQAIAMQKISEHEEQKANELPWFERAQQEGK